jgi:hypothetical protein
MLFGLRKMSGLICDGERRRCFLQGFLAFIYTNGAHAGGQPSVSGGQLRFRTNNDVIDEDDVDWPMKMCP